MDAVELAVDEAVGLLDATHRFEVVRNGFAWDPHQERTHHLHVTGPGFGVSQAVLLDRITMAAVMSGWTVRILDPGHHLVWAQHLTNVTYVDDQLLAVAESWLLTEDTHDRESATTLVVIPDFFALAEQSISPTPTVKTQAPLGGGAPHIVLGAATTVQPVEGWQTTPAETEGAQRTL